MKAKHVRRRVGFFIFFGLEINVRWVCIAPIFPVQAQQYFLLSVISMRDIKFFRVAHYHKYITTA